MDGMTTTATPDPYATHVAGAEVRDALASALAEVRGHSPALTAEHLLGRFHIVPIGGEL